MWGKQREIIRAVFNERRVAVKSGHGVGKTMLAALAAVGFIITHRPSFVITTSASWPNLAMVLWPQLRYVIRRTVKNLHNQGIVLPGRLMQLEWELDDRWKVFGISAKEPEGFGGHHNDHVMVIVDEASALSEEVDKALSGLLTGKHDRRLEIGNPLRRTGPFYQHFKDPDWRTFTIDSRESPNVVAGRTIIPGLATREWVDQMTRDWGEGSSVFQSRVAGEFPDETDEILIASKWLDALPEKLKSSGEPRILGADIARTGADRTVCWIRKGGQVVAVKWWQGLDLMATSGRILAIAKEFRVDIIFVDSIGLGAGVVDRLHEVGEKTVVGVNVSEAAKDTRAFANKRAELHWKLRTAIQSGALGMTKEERRLLGEGTDIRYMFNSRGQIQIEPKDDVKARLGRSPDFVDALAISFAYAGPTKIYLMPNG